jgi:phage baseplate assembly protein W
MAVDLKMTVTGDLVQSPSGDLLLVWGDEQIIQEVLFRLKTTKGDYLLSKQVGCSLEEFIGQPNTPLVHAAIEQRIEDELTRDLLLAMPEIDAVDVSDTEVLILIRFSSLDQEDRTIQIQAGLDLRKGLVYSRAAILGSS